MIYYKFQLFEKTSQLIMTDNIKHLPVLVDEVISYLKPKNKKYILMAHLDRVVIQKKY